MLSAVKGVAAADEGVSQEALPFFTQNLLAAGVSDKGSSSAMGVSGDNTMGVSEDEVGHAWEDDTVGFSGDNSTGTSEDDIGEHLNTASLK